MTLLNPELQIIDDALNLARAGHLDYELALGVTAYLNKDSEWTRKR